MCNHQKQGSELQGILQLYVVDMLTARRENNSKIYYAIDIHLKLDIDYPAMFLLMSIGVNPINT